MGVLQPFGIFDWKEETGFKRRQERAEEDRVLTERLGR
jgi:hypothetical protein